METRQTWIREAMQNPEDALIVEGYPVHEPRFAGDHGVRDPGHDQGTASGQTEGAGCGGERGLGESSGERNNRTNRVARHANGAF